MRIILRKESMTMYLLPCHNILYRITAIKRPRGRGGVGKACIFDLFKRKERQKEAKK